MSGSAGDSNALSGLPTVIASIDVAGLDASELALLVSDVRAAQRCLDGLVIRIGARSNRLAADGRGAPAEEVVRGCGAVGSGQARREAGRVLAAEQIRGLGEAVSNGSMSGEHVDVLARRSSRLDADQLAEFDFSALVEQANGLPVETFDRLVKRRIDAATADHGLADANAKRAASEFRHWFDGGSGMGRFSGSLDPERYEAFTTAVEHHTTAIAARSDEPAVKNSNLAAEALIELVTASSGGQNARSRLPHITVVVDHDTVVHGANDHSIRQSAAGHDVAPETVARLCCDAVIRRVMLDRDGVPINVGRRYRTATDGQWAAIKAVHTGCAWDGCDAPINWCQAHHIREWEAGGITDLANLIPLCSRHHHRVHEGQWQIKLLPDRTLKIYKPDGSHYRTVPTPKRWRPPDDKTRSDSK